jgi:hypothetical protein
VILNILVLLTQQKTTWQTYVQAFTPHKYPPTETVCRSRRIYTCHIGSRNKYKNLKHIHKEQTESDRWQICTQQQDVTEGWPSAVTQHISRNDNAANKQSMAINPCSIILKECSKRCNE